jgi:hypothetical protein
MRTRILKSLELNEDDLVEILKKHFGVENYHASGHFDAELKRTGNQYDESWSVGDVSFVFTTDGDIKEDFRA